jgi:LAO/AO transport system kinase
VSPEPAAAPLLVERLRGGDIRALARAISLVEEHATHADALLRAAFTHAGKATVVGVTGSPGAGKSSLVDRMVAHYRRRDRRVGVIAVDPSSAFSGGAILGDRIRMQAHSTDPGVFIRSMATRGHLGGLSRATNDGIDLLDAAGYDPVVVETVGVGQDEIEIARAADAVLVVLVPGMGDDIQAIKAGILEIADLFIINKADRPGADRLASDLEYVLSLATQDGRKKPEILKTVAVQDEGIEEVLAAVARHLETAGIAQRAKRRRDRAEERFTTLLAERLVATVLEQAVQRERYERIVDDIASRKLDPYSAVDELIARVRVA